MGNLHPWCLTGKVATRHRTWLIIHHCEQSSSVGLALDLCVDTSSGRKNVISDLRETSDAAHQD